jgi:nucleolar protein 14
MGKRKSSSKRSLGSLPSGLIHRKGAKPSDPGNPFEMSSRMKRPKHLVHNRPVSKPKNTKHALESLQLRQTQLRKTLMSTKKANVLVDQRIGEYNPNMSSADQMLARLVKERTRQSQRSSKFRLDDEDGDNELLTHKGKKLDPSNMETIYSDDEDDNGQLEAGDTELHFGGAGIKQAANPYGGSATSDLAQVYGQRKTELDDLIIRRKTLKAEKMQAKETQEDVVEKLDETFGDFSNLLMFRKDQAPPTIKAEPTQEDMEMNEWNKEMKAMMMTPKKRATDRTKTPEEIAKEEAERLHKMETRRLARMNGDFEEDELSDISLDGRGQSKKAKRKASRNPDELTDDEDSVSDEDKIEARFTADGLKYFDKEGNMVEADTAEEQDDDSSEDPDATLPQHPLPKGTLIQGNYRAAEQYDGKEAWYDGEITKVHIMKDGSVKYDVEYLDGDFEEDMLPENVRPVEQHKNVPDKDPKADLALKLKRSKARDKAR